MQLSDAGLALIKKSEGFSATVYTDVAGFPTIGYGHKIVPPATFEHGCTELMASTMLLDDVKTAERAVTCLVHVPLTQGQYDALVDFTYNLGASRLSSSTLLKCLNQSRYEDAAEQLLRWDMAGGQEQPGLKTRREAEFALWHGKDAADSSATRYLANRGSGVSAVDRGGE